MRSDAARDREFSRRLRTWYRRHARDLPWRATRDPYRILVSELMLQQTQVARVIPFYEAFLRRFATLSDVARARPAAVREAWEGLGYYARARNLHRLARRLVHEGGALPSDPEALRKLPGIGRYTAGAVASFAYGKRAALVDANVARVLRRVFWGPKRSVTEGPLWETATRILPRTARATYTHNQALMELGALVCTARVAHCTRCPVRAVCATAGNANGRAKRGRKRSERSTLSA